MQGIAARQIAAETTLELSSIGEGSNRFDGGTFRCCQYRQEVNAQHEARTDGQRIRNISTELSLGTSGRLELVLY